MKCSMRHAVDFDFDFDLDLNLGLGLGCFFLEAEMRADYCLVCMVLVSDRISNRDSVVVLRSSGPGWLEIYI